MNISELEAALAEAKAALEAMYRSALRGNPGAIQTAHKACLEAERAVAQAKGEEVALPCPWEAPWDRGAPLPHIVGSGSKTFLVYLVHVPDPNWDGTYVRIINPRDDVALPLALVEFLDCYALRFGGPNDEVFAGHPLRGKGLDYYGAHLISNSSWLAELQQINSIHPDYDPEWWSSYRHYLLLFHDETFECIAKGHRIEVMRDSFKRVVEIATQRLFSR